MADKPGSTVTFQVNVGSGGEVLVDWLRSRFYDLGNIVICSSRRLPFSFSLRRSAFNLHLTYILTRSRRTKTKRKDVSGVLGFRVVNWCADDCLLWRT